MSSGPYATPVHVNYGSNSSANSGYLSWEYETPADIQGSRNGPVAGPQEYVGPAPYDPDLHSPPGLPVVSPGLREFITNGENTDPGSGSGRNPVAK